MIVEIPSCIEHEGFFKVKLRISPFCPKCGAGRGSKFRIRSYDGSRWVICDGWKNPCGHIDYYEDVRAEAKIKSR